MFSNPNPMVHNDLPINDSGEDKLNFMPFVKKVANGIRSYSQDDCFILSIEGQWGIGKTSFMNLVKKELINDVTILHFNPWLVTNIEQLISVFFTELIKTLNYVSFKSKWDNDIKEDLKRFASVILPDQVNVGVTEGTKASWKIDKYFKPKDSESFKSLVKQKENINKYLRDLDKKILIVIDDIDRLMDNEIELIFRLIKGIADFDNIIYVLLFDKPIVSKSLEKFKSENGQKYLDKIIQYPLTLPKTHHVRFLKILTDNLDEFLTSLGKENYFFAEDTWNEVHHRLHKYIFTIRDVNSIMSLFKFDYVSICKDVNFVDFFLITLIKHHSIELYDFIKNNPELFIPDASRIPGKHFESTEKRRVYCIEIIKKKFIKFDDYEELLSILFPFLSSSNRLTYNNDHKRKAISDMHYFDNYFTMMVSDDKLATDEYLNLKDSILNDIDTFITKIKDLNIQKVKQFLDMFKTYCDGDGVDEFKTSEIIIGLFSFIDSLDNRNFRKDQEYADFGINYNTWIHFLGELVLTINSKQYLKSLYTKLSSENIVLLGIVLRYIEKNSSNKEVHKEFLTDVINLYKREEHTLSSLLSHKYLDQIIFTLKWIDYDFDKISDSFREELFRDKGSFFKILEKFIYKQISMPRKDYPYSISRSSLELLVQIDEVEKYINEFRKDKLTEDEEHLIKYWDNSKPDW